jgi:nitroimidazol reductase NimA-like FMN-containing flavoprotein (pyridoxamine 5'-phosphate oxidase superfamily)
MQVSRLNDEQCRAVLQRASLARLGCAHQNQPYVIPIDVAYDNDHLYVFSTAGQKIEWMRENPKVCVQVDEIARQGEWTSVVVNGTYQELPEPQFTDERAQARKLLQRQQHWWLNAAAERQSSRPGRLMEPLFFRIKIESMSGLGATPD